MQPAPVHPTASLPPAPAPAQRSSCGCCLGLPSGLVALMLVGLVLFYFCFGLYTVQPIGALPAGITVVVWRAGYNEPFFDSPDATCLRVQNGVSLLCRLAAFNAAPINRIVLRLPFQDWAYLASTGGVTFSK